MNFNRKAILANNALEAWEAITNRQIDYLLSGDMDKYKEMKLEVRRFKNQTIKAFNKLFN